MDVVIRTTHGEAEITIARAGESAVLADIVERVSGSAAPPTADVDGRPVLTTVTLNASGMINGSAIDIGPPTRAAPQDVVVDLVQVAGWGAGARQALGPGTYRIGPGRRVNAADLEIAHVDKIAFEISIDSDGTAIVTVDEQDIRIDGIGVEGAAPWATGILDVGGRAFELDRTVGRTDPPSRHMQGAPSGTIVFNRPPRAAPRPTMPPLAVSDGLDVTGEPARPSRHERRQHGGAPGSDQYVHAAFRANLAARRDAERERRHDVFPHIARAVRMARTASPHLWSTRPGDDQAFEFAIGLGDVDWRPELSFGDDATGRPESVVAELGRLSMVPITVDLRNERGVAFVGPNEFTRAAVRGLLVEACVQHGPADLDVVVLTEPDRAPVWEWVKWLPHCRSAGAAHVLVSLDQIDGWAASIRDRSPIESRPNHLTLAVVDEAAWWRDRAAPIRPVLQDASRPVRFVVLAETSNDVPNVCTTLVTELPADLARVERLSERVVDDDVQLFFLTTAVAAQTARRLAPFDDPDLDVPAASTLAVSVPLTQLLGQANLAASTLAARWRATTERSHARVPIGVTDEGPVEIDLERDGPHALIGGASGTGKSEMLRTMVVGLAAGLPPGSITFALLDLAGRSTFAACASLPHVVMHHDVSDAHLAERAIRSLRAELLGRDERAWRGVTLPRLVIVVDEPAAVATEHPQFISSLVEIAADGQRLGVHLVVATQHPSLVLDFAGALEFGLRFALRMSDGRESDALIGTRNATNVPLRTPGRGLVRLGEGEPVEFQAAMVSASCSAGGGHDLELRPYVIGRELSPMELRVVRESNGDTGSAGSGRGIQNDLSRLVGEISAAAVTVDQARTRRLCQDPLPTVVTPRRLTTEVPSDGVPFALVDLPDQQRQQVRWWEPGVEGSLLVYGTDGAGTSASLASLAVGAAERYSADDFHLYVIDAGALAPLVALPHTGAVVRHDEADRIARLVDLVCSEIDGRTASDGGRRRPMTSDRGSFLPHVAFMIDDVGALRQHLDDLARAEPTGGERPEPDEIWAGIVRIVHEGPAVGICTVATAKRERDVPTSFAAQFPARLVMRLANPSGYAAFGLRAFDIPRFVPGRALDPIDGAELQIVQPPVSLAAAVAALAAEPARSRPPASVEERST